MKSVPFVAAVVLALASPVGIAADAAIDRAISTTPSLSVIAKAPDFVLQDTAGKPVKLSDYRGRTVLLAFIFTTCPGVCPLISKQMEYVQRELKAAGLFGRQAVMLSVTVDPETDSAAVLAEYARRTAPIRRAGASCANRKRRPGRS